LDFRVWWKDHGYLFGGTQVEEITKASKAPNVLNLSIPLNLAVTKTLPEIKAMIEAKQRERLEQLGLDTKGAKSLTAGFGTYEINAKELRGRPFHEAHVIYCIWLEMGKPTINSDFLQVVRDRLLNRPRAKIIELFDAGDIDPSAHVIRTERSAHTSAQAIVNLFQRWYRDLGLVGCSSHSGRRTFITNAARKISTVGGSLRDVQHLAGHSSLQTTQRYIEGDSEARKRVVDLV
jgi:integrase/recombinase XerD